MNSEIVGLLAGCLTTLSFLPQVIHVFKTKSTKDISLSMYILFCAGVFLWIVYSHLINSIPVFIANTLTLILAGSVLFMKIFRKR
jgi:MtN3 and saliva related transmembrane protein